MRYDMINGNETALVAVSKDWVAAQTVTGLTEKQRHQHNALIAAELFKLRTAYPAQARNFKDEEVSAINALWQEVFAGVAPVVLHEAVRRFIITDRKAFFPSPGQIVGFVEQIMAEQKAEETRIAYEEHIAQLREHQNRIKNGENCSTCRFCVCREKEKTWNTRESEMGLFCQNPESYKFEGEHGYGTVADILCEFYEPKIENNESEVDSVE